MSETSIPGTTTTRTLALLLGGLLTGVLATGGLVYLGSSWLQGGTPAQAAGPPVFDDVTASSGVDHVYDGEFHYFVGGGLATFDCDGDRLPDMYVAGGTEPAALYRNQSVPFGDIRFEQVSAPVTDLDAVTGAYPIDVDSDGHTDLAVLRLGENVMLRGTGDCGFERANETWGMDGGDDWTAAFSAFWSEGESLPTFAFGNYLRLKESGERDECEDHWLIRPEGTTYSAPEVLTPGYCTLSILFSDWNRTGAPDLRMTNDRHYYSEGHEQLWDMSATPVEYSSADGWQEMRIWGMGIASQDLDEDGLPEVFLTSQGDNKLQTLAEGPAQPTYEDIALASGATAHRPFVGETLRPSTAWHGEFDDVNNDGLTDLLITKGNVDAQVDFAAEDPNNLLLGQPDGTFIESAEAAGILDYSRSRGATLTDLNADGLLDLVVVERREPMRIWRNTGTPANEAGPGNWLAIDLEQPGPNRDAIGAWLEVEVGGETIERELTIGGGHASGELGWIHFGLGEVDAVRARVTWPDGEVGGWETLESNQHLIWDRDSGPTPWSPLRD
ncbi:MAG: CRTAC1 family protein [Acidimicrobiia bacterium]|jgi:hypothetical protein